MVTCLTHGDGIGRGGRVSSWVGVGEANRLGKKGSESFVFTSWLIRSFDYCKALTGEG